jgi:hypothetical protein
VKTKLFLFCGVAFFSLEQSPGTFTSTGNMNAPRLGHTATLLTNGKILIAGGEQDSASTILASAELYDPSSGTFSATGSLATARTWHTATLLADGRVLITGGQAAPVAGAPGGVFLASAELYDPVTGTFNRTGDMTQSRGFHAAVLLLNGKVLIAGDQQESTHTAELYDPVTGTFTTACTLPLIASTLTLLNNGKVLVQGTDADGNSSAGLYDPDTAAFSPTGQIAYSEAPHEATMLTKGKVLDTALDGCGWPTDLVELYDPSGGAFSQERMTVLRRSPTTTLLPDGTVLIAGGGDRLLSTPFTWDVGHTSGAELYDPVADTFSVTGSMAGNRENHTATLLPDGTVLVAGGWRFGVGSTASAEIYHPRVLVPSPALFSLSGDGKGAGAILHAATQQIVSPSNPAVAGEALEVFGTGLIDESAILPQVAIGGRMAEVLYFGKAPGYAGLNQINVRVPSGVAPGHSVSVRLNYLGRSSNEVTISIK